MESGVITKAGACRTGIPAGTRVTFTRYAQFHNVAEDVYIDGKRVCGCLSIAGTDGGIDVS